MNETPDPTSAGETGDMPPAELQRFGHAAFDWIAGFLGDIERYPVLPEVRPGEIRAALPHEPPEAGVGMEEILRDFRDTIVPGITHWNHPGFFAYFGITASGPGIIGEALTAALNVNAMLWRSSPSATELEEVTTGWVRQLLGLPEGMRGHIQDTASTSTLVAIAAAREATGLGIREEGMSGRELPRLRLYCSEQAHSSVEKAGLTLGIGRTGTRKIPTDAEFRMRPDALRSAIEADLASGVRPFCVVATVGTTSTTSVDPLPEIAALCEEFGLWLHVDAAYGGAAAILPELRWALQGADRADSLVVNPHKWLFVPIDCSVLLLRDAERTRRAFSLVPDYLQTPEGDEVTNLMDYGPALGRRFRSLKLWMVLRYFGRSGIENRLREHIRLAHLLAGWIDASPAWERLAPAPFSTVCFRHTPPGLEGEQLDALNQRIVDAVNATGECFLSPTRLHGRLAIRLAIGNLRTTEAHVARAWELLRESA